MIRTFINERRSWIILFICLQLLTLFISIMDPAVPFGSVLYIAFLSAIIFIIFLAVRYRKETQFYQSLLKWDTAYDILEVQDAASPFELIMEERLSELTNKYKQDVTRLSSNLEQEKDELLAWIHEIKTPLTAMQLIIERIDQIKTKQQLKYEWLRIHLLLDQQLHQKRIPFMENDLYIEKTNLKSLISNEIRPLQSWCLRKGIGFDVSLQVETVTTDAKWLAFIIRQLLTNAVKYSQNADIVIQSQLSQGQTSIMVQDFGRGIDPKDLPRIFDRGFTSTTIHQDNASTGMGLYLAKNTAKTLHIQMDVHSLIGTGTTFTLTFPNKNEFISITGM